MARNAGEARVPDPARPAVEHDESAGRFVLRLGGGEEAVLEYARRGDALDFHHTFVPPARRGQGLAGDVVRAGFVYARREGLKVIPSCPYVATWARRHPDVQDLLRPLSGAGAGR